MRNKKIYKFGKIILSLIVALSLLVTPAFADELDDAAALEEENQQLENQIADEKAKIEQIQANISNIQDYITQLDAEINSVQATIDDYAAQQAERESVVNNLYNQIYMLECDIADKEYQIAYQYSMMKLRIKFIYENVGDNYVEAIFSSASFSEAFEKIQYMLEITSYDRKQMENIKAMKTQIENDKALVEQQAAQVESQIAEIESLKSAQEETQALLEEMVATKGAEMEAQNAEAEYMAQAVEELEQRILENQETIDGYKNAYDLRMEAEAAAAAQALIDTGDSSGYANNYVQSNGQFLWPLPGQYTTVTSWYGYRGDDPDMAVFGGDADWHNGIDFYAPYGTPVYNVADGVVVVAEWSWAFGNYVVVYHGNGLYTQCHHFCQAANVWEGEYIEAGAILGYVGSTGMSTGNHLHFGVSIGSVTGYVDPAPYLGL